MELITKWLKKLTIPIFLSILIYISIGPKEVYAGAYDNAYDYYNTFCSDGGKTVKWQNDAFYFCTKASSGTGIRFATLGFKITDADGHSANAAINGYCIRRVGPADIEVGGYKYNLYKIDYTYLVNYMIAAHGGSSNLSSVDHYNSWSRENRSPVYTFDAIMTTNASGSFGTMFENGDGTNTYEGPHYHNEYAIIHCGVGWSTDAKASFDNYFNITGAGANIGVDTQLLQIPDTSSPANGLYKQSPYNYYTSYGKQFTINQTAVASYNSVNFQPDMNWLHTVDVTPGHTQNWLSQYYFMYPDQIYYPISNTFKQEEWNTGDSRVNLLGWTTNRPSNTVLTTSAVVSLKYNNDSIKFQPRARIYNGYSFVDATNRTDARYLLSDSVYGGVYPEGNSVTVTVDGNKPSGSYSTGGHGWVNYSSENITFYPSDSQSGVYHTDMCYRISRDYGNTWNYYNWYSYDGSYGYTATVTVADGEQLIFQPYAYVTDNVGNKSSEIWGGYYYYDRTAPVGESVTANVPTYTNASKYTITITGVSDTGSGVNRVQFPTWTAYNNQDDLDQNWPNSEMFKGTYKGNGTWEFTVDTAQHNNEDGAYVTHIYAWDNVGNYRALAEKIIYVDRVPPGGIYTPNTKGLWNESSYTVSFDPSDNFSGVEHSDVYYKMSTDYGNTWSELIYYDTYYGDGAFNLTMNPPNEKNTKYQFYTKVYDKATNMGGVWSGEYLFDRTMPTGVYSCYAHDWTNVASEIVSFDPYDTVSGVGTNFGNIRYSTDGGATWTPWKLIFGVNYDVLSYYSVDIPEGQSIIYQFASVLNDCASNQNHIWSGWHRFDRIKPSGTITPWELGDTNQAIDVTFDPSDDTYGSGVKEWTYQVSTLDWNNPYAQWETGPVNKVVGDTSQTYRCQPVDGQVKIYVLNYTVTDKAGNTTTLQGGWYWIDRVKPTVEVTPPNRPWLNTDVTATLKANDKVGTSDKLKNVYYIWDTQNKVAPDILAGDKLPPEDTTGISLPQVNYADNYYARGYGAPDACTSKGWIKYDDNSNSSLFSYKNMNYSNTGDSSSLLNGGAHFSIPTIEQSAVRFLMNGTQFVFFAKPSTQYIHVYVDDKYLTAFRTNNSDHYGNGLQTQFISPVLSSGTHLVTLLLHAGDKPSNTFVFDRLDVKGSLLPISEIAWQTKTYPGSGNSFNTTQSREGTWYLWYYADDQCGNQSDFAVSGPYQIDKTAPTARYGGYRYGSILTFNVDNVVEELSGLKDIRVVAFDKANTSVSSQQYCTKVSGTTRYEANFNLSGSLLTAMTIGYNIYLTDYAGNVRTYTGEVDNNFSVNATIERVIAPHDPIFLAGQEGNLIISLANFVDKVTVTFPNELDAVNQNASYNLTPKGNDLIVQPFQVPITCGNGTYAVRVTGYRAGIARSVDVPLQVQGSILDKLRVRVRSH